MQTPETPGGALPEWQFFEPEVRIVDGQQKMVGFSAPDGRYYPLGDNEELVHIKSADGHSRDTFVRKDGHDILFEIWKRDK